MSDEPPVTFEQAQDLEAFANTVTALGDVFVDSGTPETLRMASSVLRRAATTLDEIASAWDEGGTR